MGVAATALAIAAMAACSAEAPIPIGPTPPPTPSDPPGPAGIEVPIAGRPFDAATILAAMRESRRPGGVPDQLETDAIAAAVAAATPTFDGQPWTTLAASGSCGASSCTLELAGTRPDSHGDDVWTFDVRPADGTVAVTMAELRGLPSHLLPTLDGLARSLLPAGTLDGLLLTSARWRPPPDGGQFVLSYRSGGEEGSCGLDLTLDAVEPRIVGETSRTC